MRKMTREEEEYYMPFLEEADRDIEENGTLSEEEFWAKWDEMIEEDRRSEQYRRKIIKLNTANTFGKILKRFIRI